MHMITLLQSVAIQFHRVFWKISYYKLRQSNFITKCDRLLTQSASGITKCDRLLLQSALGTTKYDRLYYKVRQVLQSTTDKVRRNKETNILTQNMKRSFNQVWSSDRHTHEVGITNSNLFEDNETDQVLKVLRNDNPSNLNFCYLNINSVRNKFTDLQIIINGNVDIVSIVEAKLDASFPSAQVTLKGYHAPYRPDINNKSGGILVYVKASIPSPCLSFEELCISIQAIVSEINLRKEKWLVISIYRPPLQNSEYFLNSLTKIIDYFANTYDNHLILGDFNLEPTDSALMGFLDSHSLTNLIKTNTCFKGKGSCMDLILTNRQVYFNVWNGNQWSPSYDIYNVKVLFSKYRAKALKLQRF